MLPMASWTGQFFYSTIKGNSAFVIELNIKTNRVRKLDLKEIDTWKFHIKDIKLMSRGTYTAELPSLTYFSLYKMD